MFSPDASVRRDDSVNLLDQYGDNVNSAEVDSNNRWNTFLELNHRKSTDPHLNVVHHKKRGGGTADDGVDTTGKEYASGAGGVASAINAGQSSQLFHFFSFLYFCTFICTSKGTNP